MKIQIKKLSDRQHQLTFLREDHTLETINCDTRNFLNHDLLHYIVETEAQTKEGFFGAIAAGKSYSTLGMGGATEGSPLMQIEGVVGVLHRISEVENLNQFLNNLHVQREGLVWEIPSWLTVEFLKTVKERMRQLQGQWKSTPYGEYMELHWDVNKF